MTTIGKEKGRTPAPKAVVNLGHIDKRTQILTELDEANPDFVHSYQHPESLNSGSEQSRELSGKKMEFVKDEKGEVIRHFHDPVVRQPRDFVAEIKLDEAVAAQNAVSEVVKNDNLVVKRQRKEPKG